MAAKISEKDANQDDGFQPVPDAGVTALESLIASSKEPDEKLFEDQLRKALYEPESEGVLYPGPDHVANAEPPLGSLIAMPTPEEVKAITEGDRLPTIADLEEAMEKAGQNAVQIEPDGTVRFPLAGIGPQPNGDYGVVVTVPEQMVSGVLGQAELDGVSPSEWLSVRLADFLEGWFHGK
jgi:hypothetical protein